MPHIPRLMRRKERMLSQEETVAVLERAEYGVMATVNEDGWPYAVPLSYVLYNGVLYFHCAQEGHKIDNITRDSRVCFTVATDVQAVYTGDFSTKYESVTVFGHVHKVADEAEKTGALMALCQKYLPAHLDKAGASIQHSWQRTAVYGICMERCTGKAKRLKPEA